MLPVSRVLLESKATPEPRAPPASPVSKALLVTLVLRAQPVLLV